MQEMALCGSSNAKPSVNTGCVRIEVILNASSIRKLDYIYNKIHHRASSESQSDRTTLKAIVASLKRNVASP
jgi:hypothetical protein